MTIPCTSDCKNIVIANLKVGTFKRIVDDLKTKSDDIKK